MGHYIARIYFQALKIYGCTAIFIASICDQIVEKYPVLITILLSFDLVQEFFCDNILFYGLRSNK